MADLASLQRRLESLVGVPATEGNEIDVLVNGNQIFPQMLDAIRSAQTSVELLTYAYWSGWPTEAFAEALIDRAQHGCRVRVLVDAVGGRKMDRALVTRMRDAGVDMRFFRSPWRRSPLAHNHRTHRKVLVVDRAVAFTGGVGIAQEWDGDARTPDEWRDTQIRLRGPAVAGLLAAFVQNWSETTGAPDEPTDSYPRLPAVGRTTAQIVRGTATVGWDDMRSAWYALLTAATDRITLQTAYFAPDDSFLDLLLSAAAAGVRVQLLVPGPHYDKRISMWASERHYQPLLEAGVEVFRYQPTMLHTKIATFDNQVAMIGSSNYNRRSLDHDEEVACIIFGGAIPTRLLSDFEDDLGSAEQVDPRAWRDRGAGQRLAEAAMTPISRWL